MADFGFACTIDQEQFRAGIDPLMHMLRRNYQQTAQVYPEIQDMEVYLLIGRCSTDDGFGLVPFAWFCSGDPDKKKPEDEYWRVVGHLYSAIDKLPSID